MRYFALAALFCTFAQAQDKKDAPKKDAPPKVLYAVPLVAKPGEKQKLALRGKNLAAVKEVKVEGATAKVLGAKAAAPPNNYPGERVGDSEVEIELDVPKGAKAVTVVAVNAGGESNAYELLLRDDTPVVSEKEDNGGFASAQPVPIPCAIEGTIKGERDVDVFKIEGKAGEKLHIEVQAARFGSPLDGFLTLHDADRNLIASADDVNGSPDPVLAVALPKDGVYYLSLIDAHDLGGATFGYRLVVKKGK
jgi:hypothetical protein